MHIEVSTAYAKLARAENESRRDKRPMPKHLREKFNAEIAYAKENVQQRDAAAEAMSKYPPIR